MEQYRQDVAGERDPAHDVHPLFVARWSPRAMTGESLSEEAFLPLFEAARWAPSSLNSQPWRFLYARRESDDWDVFLGFVSEKHRRWAERAAVLAVVLSKRTHEGRAMRTHSFSTGSAWQNLALEGVRRGLVVHPIGGFDHERARETLGIPEEFRLEAMTAVGVRGSASDLPEDLRSGETPSGRKPLEEVAFEWNEDLDRGDDLR